MIGAVLLLIINGVLMLSTASIGLMAQAPDYETLIKQRIQENWDNPNTLRNVSITNAFPGHHQDTHGLVVCVEYSAQDKAGSYKGMRRAAFLIKDNKVAAHGTGAPVCDPSKIKYRPWPAMGSQIYSAIKRDRGKA